MAATVTVIPSICDAVQEWTALQSCVNQLITSNQIKEFLDLLRHGEVLIRLLLNKINQHPLYIPNWFKDLPEDLISNVFDFLDFQPLTRAEQVCKLWRTHLRTYGADLPAWGRVFGQQEWPWSSVEHPLLKELGVSSSWRERVRNRQRLEENWMADKYKQSTLFHGDSVYALQFEGNLLASAGKGSVVKLWEMNGGGLLQEFHGHTDELYAVCISDSLIVSGGKDETIKIWQRNNSACRLTLEGQDSINALALSKSGHGGHGGEWTAGRLLSGSQNGHIKEWNLESGQCVQTILGHETDVYALALCGNVVVSASRDTTLKGWDLRSGQCINSLLGHEHAVYAIQWDGRRLLSGSEDMTIKIWDSGRCLRTIWGHSNSVRSLSVVGRRIVSGAWDYTINMWSTETGKCLREQLMVPTTSLHTGVAQCDTYRLVSAVIGGSILIGDYTPS